MTAAAKLAVLYRLHTLATLFSGTAVGIVLLAVLPGSAGDGITVQDFAQLCVSLVAAYATARAVDRLFARVTRPLRQRLRKASATA